MSDAIQGRPPLFRLPDEVMRLVLAHLPLSSLLTLLFNKRIASRVRYEGGGAM